MLDYGYVIFESTAGMKEIVFQINQKSAEIARKDLEKYEVGCDLTRKLFEFVPSVHPC